MLDITRQSCHDPECDEGEPPTPPSQRLSGLLFVTHVSVNKQGAQMGFSCPELVEGEASKAISGINNEKTALV